MGYMLLKHRVMDPRQKDEISEALAVDHVASTEHPDVKPWREVPSYMYHWYPTGLKERTVGPNSRKLVPVTRYYPTLRPAVVVDFEPAPPEPFFEEEKRRFFAERGIAYITLLLEERLTTEEFAERAKVARAIAHEGRKQFLEDQALAEVSVEQWMQAPDVLAAIDRECLRLCVLEEQAEQKLYRGVARQHVIKRIKRELLDRLRNLMRGGVVKNPLAWLAEQGAPDGVAGSGRDSEPAQAAQ